MTDKGNKIFRVTEILQPEDIISALRQVAIFLAGMSIVSGAIYLLGSNEIWINFFRNTIIGFVISLILLQLVKANKTLLATYATLILCGFWLFSMAWDGAGVGGTVYTMFVLVIIGTGLFIGRRAGYLTALIISLSGLFLLFAGRAGWLANIDRPITDVAALINTTFTFFIAAHLIRLAIDQVERALGKAQNEVNERMQAEDEIRRLNVELKNKVDAEQQTGKMRQRLLDFSRELLATVDVAEILEIIRRTASDLVAHDVFAPYWVDNTAGVLRRLKSRAVNGSAVLFTRNGKSLFGQGIIGDVARKQQAECVNNSHLDPRAIPAKSS